MIPSRRTIQRLVFAGTLASCAAPVASVAQDAAPLPTVSDDSEAGFTPFGADEDEALALARNYLAALDEGRYDDAYAMQASAMDALASRGAWDALSRGFYDQAGALVSRRITAVTWTHYGEGSTNSGTFVALDLVGRFTRADRECTYLILFRPLAAEGLQTHLQVLRIQNGFLLNAMAQKVAAQGGPEAVRRAWHAVARTYPHCPDDPPAGG